MRKKKEETKEKVEEVKEEETKNEVLVPEPIAVDFPNEGLNNLARKINQVIEFITKPK